MKEELLETLRAGPGEAARREVAVGASGPAPSRWTLRTMRASVEWLTDYTLSGGWRVLQSCGLGLHSSGARLFSPAPDYASKVRRLPRCLRAAARHPLVTTLRIVPHQLFGSENFAMTSALSFDQA